MKKKLVALLSGVMLGTGLLTPTFASEPVAVSGHGAPETSFTCQVDGGPQGQLQCENHGTDCITLAWSTVGVDTLTAYAEPPEADWNGSKPVHNGAQWVTVQRVCPTVPTVYFLHPTLQTPFPGYQSGFDPCVENLVNGTHPVNEQDCWHF